MPETELSNLVCGALDITGTGSLQLEAVKLKNNIDLMIACLRGLRSVTIRESSFGGEVSLEGFSDATISNNAFDVRSQLCVFSNAVC